MLHFFSSVSFSSSFFFFFYHFCATHSSIGSSSFFSFVYLFCATLYLSHLSLVSTILYLLIFVLSLLSCIFPSLSFLRFWCFFSRNVLFMKLHLSLSPPPSHFVSLHCFKSALLASSFYSVSSPSFHSLPLLQFGLVFSLSVNVSFHGSKSSLLSLSFHFLNPSSYIIIPYLFVNSDAASPHVFPVNLHFFSLMTSASPSPLLLSNSTTTH